MYKKLLPVLLLAVLIAIAPLKSAYAAAAFPTCPDTLSSWDWPSWVKKDSPHSGTITGGGVPTFDPGTSSYVYVGLYYNDVSGGQMMGLLIMDQDPSKQVTLVKDSSTSTYRIKASTGHNLYTLAVEDYSSGTGGHKVFFNSGNTSVQNISTMTSTYGNTVTCVEAAHGAIYDSSWDADTFGGIIGYTAGVDSADSASSCSPVDIGCWIGKAFDGVQNTLVSVAEAIVHAFAILWQPDATKTNDQFTSLSDFLQTKLGFITYPFTFLVDVFNAFTSDASWCTASSCTKDFGNFFGHDFHVDLAAFSSNFPTYWTWFTGMVRGTTVLAVVLALRNKYRSITHK